jgi:hypothetical protein
MFRRPEGSRGIANRAKHLLEGDEGCEDENDDSDEGNTAVNIAHDFSLSVETHRRAHALLTVRWSDFHRVGKNLTEGISSS